MTKTFFYASANGKLINFDGIAKFDSKEDAQEYANKCRASDITEYDEYVEYVVFSELEDNCDASE